MPVLSPRQLVIQSFGTFNTTPMVHVTNLQLVFTFSGNLRFWLYLHCGN